jgi:hypothetical protein
MKVHVPYGMMPTLLVNFTNRHRNRRISEVADGPTDEAAIANVCAYLVRSVFHVQENGS